MKYIMVQPAVTRFKWELDVQLTNLTSLGVKGSDIVLLFAENVHEIPEYFREHYGVQAFVYSDDRDDKSYIPSIKPYLWWRFLIDQPWAEHEQWFYMDADVIFRELPTGLDEANEKLYLCSNTDSYLGPKYIKSKGGYLFDTMQMIVDVDVSDWDGKSGGAQWVITNPTAKYWQKVYKDCNELYAYMCSVEADLREQYGRDYEPIQAWTAEMWSQLWNLQVFGIEPKIIKELDFAFATDDISRWDEVKILHNAGVIGPGAMFFKGQYTDYEPFDEDFSSIDRSKCSYRYVEAILKAKENALSV